MQANELKFLLKLLGHEGYQAPISKLAVTEKASSSERDRICRNLGEREIVEYSREVTRFKITTAGKALLKQEASGIPLAAEQLLILKACEVKSITPGQLKKLPANERQSLIQELETKGLIEIEKAQIKEVWLTHRGAEYLCDEYSPRGTPTISLNLLGNYLSFLRKSMRSGSTTEPLSSKGEPLSSIDTVPQEKVTLQEEPTDEAILQLIRNLDREIGTENYLPIFHLRQKLQPPLSRDELDQALYRLQRQDKLELSSLVEAIRYTPEQIQAGIPQDAGGPLFFLRVND